MFYPHTPDRPGALVRGLRSALLGLAILGAVAAPARAVRGVRNYPKVAQYVAGVVNMTPAQRDTLAWYDLALMVERPAIVEEIRERNPDIELFYNWMPQNFAKSTGSDTTWWYPDTTWSLIRLSQFYAMKNNWYLRDTAGNRIPEWSGYAANWTRYCPLGVYGSAVGLTYVEWLVQVAIPRVVTSGNPWPKWGPGSGGYDGLMLEILVDCVGSFGWQTYANADPDRDGQAEGVNATCTGGGWDDSLSVLYREMNDVFEEEMARLRGEGVVVMINGANDFMGPSWRTELSGVKVERWMSYLWSPWVDWWQAFHGVLDIHGEEMIGPGYKWAEDFMDPGGNDPATGWDHSTVEVVTPASWPDAKSQRLKRWGLGTTLLGDGFFIFTKQEGKLFWQPEFEWDLGEPTGAYQRQAYVNGATVDTLYWREFTKGFAEVNPYDREVNGIPAQDARFGFWQTVEDLNAEASADDSARVTFTMPAGTPSPIDGVELRYATHPISAQTWDEATSYAGNPIESLPGSPVDLTISGLDPGSTWYFAARNRVYSRLEPGTSNVASIDLPLAPADITPPDPIDDLAAVDAGTSWVRLSWNAPADPDEGAATQYRIRYRAGAAIQTLTDWAAATPAPGVYPSPAAPGSPQLFTVQGLGAGTSYAFAVRAEDSAGNLSALSNPLTAGTDAPPPPPPPPPPDTIPPAPITDLSAAEIGLTSIELRWSAPGDDGAVGSAAAYAVRYLADRPILTEADWEEASLPSGTIPVPSNAGTAEAFRIEGLESGRLYGVAVRATDDAGNVASLSTPFSARTLVPEEPPPDPPELPVDRPPTAITDLTVTAVDSTSVTLRWTAPDDGEGNRVSTYRLAYLAGDSLRTAEDVARCTLRALPFRAAEPGAVETSRIAQLTPATLYGFALFALDSARVVGDTGSFAHARTVAPPAAPVDTSGPASIDDLAADQLTSSSLRLSWTAPKDEAGTVVSYEVRALVGRPIAEEPDWSQAAMVQETPPDPSFPGETDFLLLSGLAPETAYGFAVRARDGSGNLSSLGTPFLVSTPALPDLQAPPVVADLQAEAKDPITARLEWSAVEDDSGGPVSYRVGLRPGASIASESDWAAAETSLVVPAESDLVPGRLLATLAGLQPLTTYGIALRAIDAAGNRSALPESPHLFSTPDWPDTLPPTRIVDLGAAERALTSILLRWTAPHDSLRDGPALTYQLGRLESAPVASEEDWDRAEVVTGFLAPSAPGTIDTFRVSGLKVGTGYGFALRSRDAAGLLSPLSNALYAETLPDTLIEPPPDTTDAPPDTTEVPDLPPAPITDLSLAERGADFAVLRWTASGEDSLQGTAAAVEVRFLADAQIMTDSDWALAQQIPSPPEPAPAGTVQQLRWSSIAAELVGGVAVRTRDAAGQWSRLGRDVWLAAYVALPPPPPPLEAPPAPSLRPIEASVDAAVVALGHPARSATRDSTVRYEARLDTFAVTAERWVDLPPLDGVPPPGEPGTEEHWTLQGLLPDRAYFLAVRAIGARGLESPLVSIEFSTGVLDLAPPDPPGQPSLHWSADQTQVTLRWAAATDPRVAGYHLYGESPAGTWLRLTPSPLTATEVVLPRPNAATLRRLAVRSHLTNGTESALSTPVDLWESEWEIEGPFPHPVTDGCRIRVRLPADFPPSAILRVEIRSLEGDREATLHDGSAAAGLTWEGAWDRRTLRGALAPPGLHRLICEGGGRRTVRTIYLAP